MPRQHCGDKYCIILYHIRGKGCVRHALSFWFCFQRVLSFLQRVHLRVADFWLVLIGLGGNRLSTSACNSILTLFYGEKSSPARKKSSYEDKPFAAQTPPRKRGYVEDFTLKSVNAHQNLFAPPKAQKLSFYTVHIAVLRNRRATGARIWGSVQSYSFIGTSVIFYILQQSTGRIFLPCSLARDDFYKC